MQVAALERARAGTTLKEQINVGSAREECPHPLESCVPEEAEACEWCEFVAKEPPEQVS